MQPSVGCRDLLDPSPFKRCRHLFHCQPYRSKTERRGALSDRRQGRRHPDTGDIEPGEYTITDDRTIVPLGLDQRESLFVVFRRKSASPSRTLSHFATSTLATVDGPWEVNFPENLGAPAKVNFDKLQSWTANADEGVKNFSGTATYNKVLTAPENWFHEGDKILLDLGTVKDLAEVSVNGKTVATVWKPPYQADVTGLLTPGENRLEIKVTNQWTNRLIGDRSVPPEKRVLASEAPRFGPPGGPPPGKAQVQRAVGAFGGPQTLSEAGLIGPVTVVSKTDR